jgi:hypothetical protein
MSNVKVQFAVSVKVAAGKCAPQIAVRDLPTHESGKARSLGVSSTLTFKFKDGTEGALTVRDNGNAHGRHQLDEVSRETFGRIFSALKAGGVTKPVACTLTDSVGALTDGLSEIEL